jgi:hypothetical protein
LVNGILDERLDAAVRIERFGSPAILPDVKRAWSAAGATWSCEVRGAVLGYLARVDAAGSRATLRGAIAAATPESDECHEAYLRVPALRSALLPKMSGSGPWTIIARGPTPGDERRHQFLVGDREYHSVDELIDALQRLPAGTTLMWTYASGTAATHPEQWTASERAAMLQRVSEAATARGLTVMASTEP